MLQMTRSIVYHAQFADGVDEEDVCRRLRSGEYDADDTCVYDVASGKKVAKYERLITNFDHIIFEVVDNAY